MRTSRMSFTSSPLRWDGGPGQGCGDTGGRRWVIPPSPDGEGDSDLPVLGTKQVWGWTGQGRGGTRVSHLGFRQRDPVPKAHPSTVPQERQNIIRYWLENLRAKQGEALHNIHFLEGQPISEYGTARLPLPTHLPAALLCHGSTSCCPQRVPVPAGVPIPAAHGDEHGHSRHMVPSPGLHTGFTRGTEPPLPAVPLSQPAPCWGGGQQCPSLTSHLRCSPRAGGPRRHPAGLPTARAEDPQTADEVVGAGDLRGAATR